MDWVILGGQTTLVGMAVVFVVLTILAVVIRLLGTVSGKKAVQTAAEGQPVVTGEASAEVAAVIAGAVSAYLGAEGLVGKVVTVRRTPVEAGVPVWSAVGRQELIASRLSSSWRKEKGYR